jgi:hypothetical protein
MNSRVSKVLNKRADAISDYAQRIPSSVAAAALTGWNPVTPALISGISESVGSYQAADDKAAAVRALVNQSSDEEENRAWMPGYSGYKIGRRRALINQILQDSKKGTDHDTGSRALYDNLKWLNPLNILASPVAGLAALLNERRSLKEQQELANDNYYGLKSMLIPGWNSYQQWKTIGASDHLGSRAGLDRLTAEDLKAMDQDTRNEVLAQRDKLRKQTKPNKQKQQESARK